MKNNWGIIGAGRIAGSLASALTLDKHSVLFAVASSNAERGTEFMQRWDFKKVYTGVHAYNELIADANIDVVYIATPHVNHAELSIAAMKAGKAVLCEKPAAVNAADARRIIKTSKETGMFFMEAMWTKFQPAFLTAMDWIRSGNIGSVQLIHADFCINRPNAPRYIDTGYKTHRLYDMHLAGGALLDAGIYPVTLAMNAAAAALNIVPAKAVPSNIVSTAKFAPEGVDISETIHCTFGQNDTIQAQLYCSLEAECGPDLKCAYICGTNGTIKMKEFWYCRSLELLAQDGTILDRKDFPFDVNGYEYEVREANRLVLANKAAADKPPVIESALHTHADTIAALEFLDTLRAQWNFTYPFENKNDFQTAACANTRQPPDAEIISVYTDGACSGNPGKGGWGAIILADGEELPMSGCELSTTNNRMELTAAIKALQKISRTESWRTHQIEIFSDSQYVKNGICSWISSWKRNGWQTASKQPVKNRDLWLELDALNTKLSIEWKWVKGHAGNKYNELCDSLATAFQKQ